MKWWLCLGIDIEEEGGYKAHREKIDMRVQPVPPEDEIEDLMAVCTGAIVADQDCPFYVFIFS